MANIQKTPRPQWSVIDKFGHLTRPWKEWFDSVYTTVAAKLSFSGTLIAGNIPVFSSSSEVVDSGIAASDVIEPTDIIGTANQIDVTDNGDGTVTHSLPDAVIFPGTVTFPTYERHIQVAATLSGTPADQPTAITVGTAVGFQFPSNADKYIGGQWECPDDWAGDDIYIEIDWLPDSGAMSGTDTIKWDLQYRSIAEGELITQGAIATVSVTNTDDNAQYKTIHSKFTIAFDHADQPVTAQDHIYFLFNRDVSVANDFAGTVVITAFEVIYNSTSIPTSN